jgi:acyl carrier protein
MSAPSPQALRSHLKSIIVRACGLTHVTAEEITDEEILFGPTTRVQLNSLDAVEIAVNVEIEYGVKLENSSSAREYFKSVATLADHVASKMEPARLQAFEKAA